MFRPRAFVSANAVRALLPCVLAALLGACGGGSNGSTAAAAQAPGQTVTMNVELPATAADAATASATPRFHAAPVMLDAPADDDVADPAASSLRRPHTQVVPQEFSRLSTRGLTWGDLDEARRSGGVVQRSLTVGDTALPMVTGTVVTTYTPAQIRAAYGMPVLPAAGAAVSSSQAAQLGAGQTIYIVDAQHDPSAAAELAGFNQHFGLPACTTLSIAPASPLPLPAAAASSGCGFAVVYSSASGAMTSTAPAYDSGWATEIALDVQWAHATAPLARIILIEAPDASVNSLLNAVSLANAMGPGIVSMSFGAPEGNWTASVESVFAVPGMTYVAAAGDSGAAVDWPAVSPHVVAIGGTSLTYSGSGGRSESVWSGTGGGVSAYTATPGYQTSSVPGMGTPGHRAVTDVSFNADPATGQYLAVQSPGSATVNWMSAGGTSVSAPQWAGLFALANAQLALRAQAPMGAPHAALYGRIATSATSYAGAFGDVTSGANGSCAGCAAKAGYDLPTGLGTPTVSGLLGALAGTNSTAPVVSGGVVSGTVGSPLSFAVTVNATNALSYTITGAPAGMTISAAGVVGWSAPVAGTFSVTVGALDLQTGLSGQGIYTITISAPQAPQVAAANVAGNVGSALSFTVAVSNANPVTYTLAGAPAGLSISSAGVISWATPVAGSYKVTVTARDARTGLSGQGILTITIAPPKAPVVGATTINGNTASALSFTVAVTATNPLTYVLSSAPAGMSISASGVVTWAKPVAGKYSVTVKATDTRTGLSGQGSYSVNIVQAGPVLTASTLSGVSGSKLTGTITVADATSTMVSIQISGVPVGMTFTASGSNLLVTWPAPVTGSYKLTVSARDANGLTATLVVPVNISAR